MDGKGRLAVFNFIVLAVCAYRQVINFFLLLALVFILSLAPRNAMAQFQVTGTNGANQITNFTGLLVNGVTYSGTVEYGFLTNANGVTDPPLGEPLLNLNLAGAALFAELDTVYAHNGATLLLGEGQDPSGIAPPAVDYPAVLFDGGGGPNDWIQDNDQQAGPGNAGANFGLITWAAGVADPSSAQVFGNSAQTGVHATNLLFQLLGNQVRRIADGLGAGGFAVTVNAPSASTPALGPGDTQLSSFGNSPEVTIRAQNEHLLLGGWDGWVTGYGVGGNVHGTGAAAGFDYTMGATQVGLYRLLASDTLIGLFGGYSHQYIGVDAAVSQAVGMDDYFLGAFLRRANCCFGLDGYTMVAVAACYDDYGSDRATATGTAEGDYDGAQTSAYIERGVSRQFGCYTVEPMAAIQYTWLNQNGFTETGAGINNLTVNHAQTQSLRTLLGSRITTTRCTRFGEVLPEFRAQWMHELLDATTGITATAGGAPAFVSPTAGLGRNWAILGGGLTIRRNSCLALNVNYDLQFNDRTQFHIGSGGVEFSY